MRAFIYLFVLVFFVGCGPKYVIKNSYQAPKDKNSLECTKICASTKQSCDKICTKKYETCKQDAYNRAKEISNIEFIKYNEEYTLYQDELRVYRNKKFTWDRNFNSKYRDYKYFSKKCSRKSDKYSCVRQGELSVELRILKRRKPIIPFVPLKPSFNNIYENELKSCNKTCNCQNEYDNCFINCGGTITPYKICVSNCD